MKKIIIILFAGLVLGGKVSAQTDPHFSQYYAYPMFLNPGLTGVMDGEYRVTGIYRSQWNNINNGFSTAGVSGELSTSKNLNLGVNVINQSAGGGAYNNLNGYVSVAYTGVKFGKEGTHRVSIGLSAGAINRHYNVSKFTSGSQWTPIGFDPATSVNEQLTKTSATTFDAGAGVLYFDATPGKKANIYAGFSAYHLTQPTDPFILSGTDEKMPVRYTGHAGIKLSLSDQVSVTPNLLYMKQGTAEEKMAGAYVQLRVNESADFLVGGNYRLKDAFSPYLGVYYNNMVIGASYDVHTSDLSKIAGNVNSFELSVTFTGKRKAKTEPVPFVCPRL